MLRGPYRKKYLPDQMARAEEAIKCGMAVREASRKFDIPRATLQDRLHGRVLSGKSGPQTVLTAAEETKLVLYMMECGKVGFPLDKSDVKETVKNLLDDDGRPNPFKENKPGTLCFNKMAKLQNKFLNNLFIRLSKLLI